MNNRYSLLAPLLFAACIVSAQNVGIGTLIPQAKLHVFSSDNTAVLAEANTASKYAGFEAKTNGGVNDNLFVRKWMPGSSGTMAGINLDNLSMVVAGVGAGPLLLGVANNNPIYFTTNNTQRLRILANGKIGVNTSDPFALFTAEGRADVHVTGFFSDTVTTGGQRAALIASINTTAAASSAIGASTYEGGGVSPLELGTYAIVGSSGNAGYSVAGYSIGSTALRGKSISGKALHTSGQVKMDNLGEGVGKVLTSDASGNATWQSLPASVGTWAVVGNNIYNTNSGYVGINDNTPSARLDIRSPSVDSAAFQITHPGGVRISRIDGSRQFYHEGELWVHSLWGRLRYGYADKGWFWGTINGGQDLQLWSHSSTDLDGSRVKRLTVEGTTGDVLINNDNVSDHAQLRVERGAGAGISSSGNLGAIAGINQNTTSGSGVYGVSVAGRAGAIGYAGVTGVNVSNESDRFGVIGQSSGTSAGSLYSAGVGGYGDYGVLGYSQSNTGAGIIAQHNAGKTALEINNGFIKATGSAGNKTAFTITATAGNSSGYILPLNYANQLATDILIVTHNYNPPGAPLAYNTSPYSVFWSGTNWSIYFDNFAAILNQSFNVLVIKQ